MRAPRVTRAIRVGRIGGGCRNWTLTVARYSLILPKAPPIRLEAFKPDAYLRCIEQSFADTLAKQLFLADLVVFLTLLGQKQRNSQKVFS
ncbi:hypothetical protein Bphy_3747 [Paraburkholderia phymatum STM815]|uniref:Uncharacterized protein n=1 Tax=Paraburkholderia phymatum (strain DSM 17167 / CIP 108236 / LMG 21445 / STM815) TaxID=391038 RepID=B2JN33_PARP8|nr:hypothetical protein Bphy_3747 [Paraburkholderia phymatum STM815]